MSLTKKSPLICALSLLLSPLLALHAADKADESGHAHVNKPGKDFSGKTRKGKASYYARKLAGKTMADGTPMNPNANIAASKTLPLGTKAKVTNLENGKSTVVEIRDRGPYVKDRIVDLSPKAAEKIDIKKDGVAPVAVTPIDMPQPETDAKR